MNSPHLANVIEQMKARRYREALGMLREFIAHDPSYWNAWYLAGQCCRFLGDLDGAIKFLSKASTLKEDEPPIFLALGIAFQLKESWDDALEAFRRAIELDNDYELAYNSLALTQKKCGSLDFALHNYDAGVKALGRRIVKAMRNSRSSPIFKHKDTTGLLWVEYAIYAALYRATTDVGIEKLTWLTGDQANQEERNEFHAGLYWVDTPGEDDERTRLLLPNYINSFREELKQGAAYSNFIGNRGTVLELLGRKNEAQLHFREAEEFSP